MEEKALKILSVPVDRGGCGWYRVRQPFQAIQEYTSSDAHVLDKEGDDPLAIAQAVCQADILVVRQGGEAGIGPLKHAANLFAKEANLPQGFHAKIVIDIDDNMEIISPYSEHYGEYGVTDFYDAVNKVWLWKDGQTQNFDLARNRDKVMSFTLGMRKADLVTVTTEELARYARQYNSHVAILPNAIDDTKWRKVEFAPHKQLRVGWTGGHSHYEDWYTIKEPLNKLLRQFQFKLIMGGTGYQGLIDEDLRHLVEEKPWVPFEAHPFHTMLHELDIAIIPLADTPFNKYKSAVKWLEFSAAGIASVVANVTPYAEVITPQTAWPYDTADQFYHQLKEALSTIALRELIGKKAREFVVSHYTARKHAKTWLDAYYAIL